jgi:hypothetical protein
MVDTGRGCLGIACNYLSVSGTAMRDADDSTGKIIIASVGAIRTAPSMAERILSSVAATAGVRMGMRAARKAPRP